SERRISSGKVMMVRVIASRTASAPCPARAGPFFMRGASPCPAKPGKMQQHREACRTLNQRADRGAAKTKDEVSLPVTRHRAIGRFGGALTDHDLRRDKALTSPAYARPG